MTEHTLADRLLNAHVAYQYRVLTSAELEAQLDANLAAALLDAEQLKLADVVTPKAVKEAAHTYALDLVLGGAIPALVGDIIRAVVDHSIHGKTTLQDLVPDDTFEEWLDKLLELDEARNAVLHLVVTSPVFSALIAELLYSGVRGYVSDSKVADRIPGARSALKIGKKMASRAKPDLADAVDGKLRDYAHANTQSSLAASEEFLRGLLASPVFREGLLDIWAEHKHSTLSDLRGYLSDEDIEELFVTGYEHWQHLRGTAWLRKLIDAGIDVFFKTFRKHTLRELLDAIGVTPQHIRGELLRFAPPAIAGLDKKGLLEPTIRRTLAPFYASPEAQAVLDTLGE